MKMSQTSPASRWKFWHPSGQYLSSASEVVAAEETIQPPRGKLLISAVTHSGAHLFRHRPDHFTGHSRVACPFAYNSFPLVYFKLLARSQPGPVAVFLGQTLKQINQNEQQTDPFCSLFFRRFLFHLWQLQCCHGDEHNVATDLAE